MERFERAAEAGFKGVECQFPYAFEPRELAVRLARFGLEPVLFNMPPGDWAAGDRGLAALPERKAEFRESLNAALSYARALGCKRVHAMSGVIPKGEDRAPYERAFLENIRAAADAAAPDGIAILIEALNDRDNPGYFITHQLEAAELVRRVDRPNVAVQLDYYHTQIMDGDLTSLTERLAGSFGHVQIASVPGRHEPDRGEIRYEHVFETLEKTGYGGWIGCEYHPAGATEAGLAWLRNYI